MSLRSRLWLVLGALVVVPLVVGAVVAVGLGKVSNAKRENAVLGANASAVASALGMRCETAGLLARSVAAAAATGSPQAVTAAAVTSGSASWVAVLSTSGGIVAESGQRPTGASGALSSCSRGATLPGYETETAYLVRPTASGVSGATTAVPAGNNELRPLARSLVALGSTTVTVVGPQRTVTATTAEPDLAARLAQSAPQSGDADIAGLHVVVSPAGPYSVIVAAPMPSDRSFRWLIVLVVGTVIVLDLLLVRQLSAQLTSPVAELTLAAERIAEGDLQQTLPVRRADEIGRLAQAFNHMTAELRRTVSELERSSDELRSSVERLGGALGSTHDLAGLLQVVLDSAVAVTNARSGAAWASDGAGPLRLVATHGDIKGVPERVSQGPGVLGRAASGAALERNGDTLALPLLRGGRVMGLLQLRARPGSPIGPKEEASLRALAGQAGVAVDNVQLHREAQRLSITDPLTGLWNFRYLSMTLAREIERSARFGRSLCVIMLDLDHFKGVNDTYGHARGDAVLRELAARVTEQIREVDVLARYGGEEFVLVLPETTLEGATSLAERICTAVRRQPFGEEGEEPLKVTVSIGVAAFPQDGASAATLMRSADQALYAAKAGGRDRWRTASS